MFSTFSDTSTGRPKKNETDEYINIFSPNQAFILHFQLCREESMHEHLE